MLLLSNYIKLCYGIELCVYNYVHLCLCLKIQYHIICLCVTEKSTLISREKGYADMSLKRLP
jgi:hypothetical protein